MPSLKTTLAKFILLGLLAGAFFFFTLEAKLIWLPLVQFSLGLLVGVGLLKFDKVVLAPRYNDETHQFVITRSFLFLIAFAAAAVLMVTSSGSIVGNGLALGIASSLLVEMTHLRLAIDEFHQTFLAQVTKRYSQSDITRLVIMSWVYFFALVGLVFRF